MNAIIELRGGNRRENPLRLALLCPECGCELEPPSDDNFRIVIHRPAIGCRFDGKRFHRPTVHLESE